MHPSATAASSAVPASETVPAGAVVAAPVVAARHPESVRVHTLNLWTGPHLAERVDAAAAVIADRSPEVVCLQEVRFPTDGSPSSAHLLAAQTSLRVAAETVTAQLPDGGAQGNAILTSLPVHEVGEVGLPGKVHAGRCCAVYAWLSAPSGRPLLAVSTHLAWGLDREADRLQQAVALDDLVKRELNENHHGWGGVSGAGERDGEPVAFIGADCNSLADSDTLRWLTGRGVVDGRSAGWVDAWAVSGVGDGFTSSATNSWSATTAAAVGMAPAAVPSRRIDYLLLRGWVHGRPGHPLATRVVYDEPAGAHAVLASDHFGVEVDLWVPPARAGG